MWQSFRARLIVGAVIWIAAGMAVSYLALFSLMRGHIEREFIEELDHHLTELTELLGVGADGAPFIRQPLSDHRFFEARSGYYWQAGSATGAAIASRSLGDVRLALTLPVAGPPDERQSHIMGPTGAALVLERRIATKPDGERLLVALAIDVRLVDTMLARLRRSVGLTLATIAAGLMAAAVIQVSFGLLPLKRVSQALAAIRRGELRRLPDDLPREVAPLAASMNALISTNEEIVRRTRTQSGNLAHALKTPLAILMDEAARIAAAGGDGAVIHAQCERMRRQIDYELAKARSAASRSGAGAAARLAPALRDVVMALDHLHRGRALAFEVDGLDENIIVACEREDLDELLGNLIDNAAKWARARVRITVAETAPGRVSVTVEDDGLGMPAEAHERVFTAGERLDELVPGTGLGLAIVRDIAEIYGGSAWLDASSLGGVAAHIALPVVQAR